MKKYQGQSETITALYTYDFCIIAVRLCTYMYLLGMTVGLGVCRGVEPLESVRLALVTFTRGESTLNVLYR